MQTLQHGECFHSPGGSFTYQVIGPICRLYDREELPYPCCSLQWRGKQPSWNRNGKRLIPDIAAKFSASYYVLELETGVLKPYTMYWIKLDPPQQQWWVTPSCKLSHYYVPHQEHTTRLAS